MPSDFIRDLVARDVANHKHGGKVVTRFPPEPNGYLHIGHAKSICLNFGLAQEFSGVCHLRMDDTNPDTEDQEYVEAIQRDVRWLGFDWREKMFYASDYYGRLYEIAQKLIAFGRAFVCDCDEQTMGELRGTVTEPGKNCPHRDRSVAENLDLLARMRAGEFDEGTRTLRAKIDMSAANMKMRDPPLYRIKRAHHYRQGDAWCIYPLYDYAHCLSDSLEGITHSLCTTEFESARELYDWVLRAAEMPHLSEQTEFARLNLSYTVMSKRKLLQLVEGKHVAGWDDPRLPTIAGLRRRGATPEAISDFCGRIGVAKNLSMVEIELFEHVLREDLDQRSRRVLGVLRPLKVVVENFAPVDDLDAPYWPLDSGQSGSRKLPFGRELFIEQSDFSEAPPKDWKRLAPDKGVRLRHGYVVTCTGVSKDSAGNVVEVRVTMDPSTRGGETAQKGLGTIHWVDGAKSIEAEVRLFDRLFTSEDPGAAEDFLTQLNPRSLEVVRARVEPSLAAAQPGEHFQLERTGFFVVDPDTRPGALVLGRTVSLKDTFAKAAPQPKARKEEHPQSPPPPAQDAEAAAQRTLLAAPALHALVEEAVKLGAGRKEATALAVNELLGELRARKLEHPPFPAQDFAELCGLLSAGKVTSRLAKELLSEMLDGKGSPRMLFERQGMLDAPALDALVREVLAANPALVAKVKAGNANVAAALFGQAMKKSGGRADPQELRRALDDLLR